ncbi:MAG: sialate O-acetylesterase [Verrucomicrobiae bacterium]|nr:sialate O-acetylesterase [Verrucomicrobiae bacterium]
MKNLHPMVSCGRWFCLGLLAVWSGSSLLADVRLPRIFSDNMVLQQGASVPVWGWADEGEQVTVTCQGQRVTTVAKNGRWLVRLNNLRVATAEAPETLTVDGKNRIRFQNVLVGEVWLASGQSNMEWPLDAAFEPEKDIATATNDNIRLFTVDKVRAYEPQEDLSPKARWLECRPFNVPKFSAVGYYFARALQQARNVPVGIIHTSWGGSPAEVWMSLDALKPYPDLLQQWEQRQETLAKYEEALKKWQEASRAAKARGEQPKGRAPGRPWIPTELYNGMLYPLAPYAVKGAIWYQGESNAGRAWQYRTLFPDLIKNWRATWGQPEFYFMAVQLAPFMARTNVPTESAWAELREAQLLATKLPGVGLAVITDVGEENDIHPRKKQPVGERLALAARGIAYKERGLVYSGPVFKKMTVRKNQAVLTFDHVGDGLEARGGELKGFAICGEDRQWVWGQAQIGGRKNDEVIVSHPNISKPVAVRYGWANFPEGNLWNKNGLPASPFRTDDFPLTTMPKPKAP